MCLRQSGGLIAEKYLHMRRIILSNHGLGPLPKFSCWHGFRSVAARPQIWRPQAQFSASIRSKRELDSFNDIGAIAVYIDINLSDSPNIAICGSQSETLSFWETNSSGGFLTKPKFTAELLTFRFVRCGQILYRYQNYETIASKMIAVLADFESLREVQALGTVSTLSATIAAATLASAQKALSVASISVSPRWNGLPI